MPIRYAASIAVLIAFIGGCAPSTPPASTPPPAAEGSTEKPASGSETTAEAKPSEGETQTSTGPAFPEALKSRPDVIYGGLLETREREFAVNMNGESTGTVRFEVSAVDGTTVRLKRINSGALAATGTESLEVNDKGLVVTGINPGKLTSPQMELPKNFAVGSTWTQKGTFEMESGVFTQEATLKAVAQEKVKVRAGEFEAIRVTLTGSMTAGEIKGKMSATLWYAKNVGLVKATTKLDRGDNPSIDQSIELTSLK